MRNEDARAIMRAFRDLEAEVESLRRQVNNIVREGRVTDRIDYARGLAEVELDGGLVSRMVPWVQRAGTVKDWDPPSPGERILMLSPTGDPARSLILPGGWTDDNAAPDNRGGARTITTEGDFTVRAGGLITLEAAGNVVIKGARIDLN